MGFEDFLVIPFGVGTNFCCPFAVGGWRCLKVWSWKSHDPKAAKKYFKNQEKGGLGGHHQLCFVGIILVTSLLIST